MTSIFWRAVKSPIKIVRMPPRYYDLTSHYDAEWLLFAYQNSDNDY